MQFEGEGATRPERAGGVIVFWMLLVIFLLAAGGYAYAAYLAGDKLPRGTEVAGVDIGGREPTRAEAALRNGLRPVVGRPVTLLVADRVVEVPAEDLGLAVDYPASVGQATGGLSWTPARLWDYWLGGERLDAVVRIDGATLTATLDELVADVERPAREGSVTFSRTSFRPIYPIDGLALDRPEAADRLRQRWLDGLEIELPLVPGLPDITDADVEAAVRDFAEPAASGPVTLRRGAKAGGGEVTLRPRDFLALLSLEPGGEGLRPGVDAEALAQLATVEMAAAGVLQPPRDATIQIRDGAPRITAARPGEAVRADVLARRFLRAVASKKRTAVVATQEAPPDFTPADARALQITERIEEAVTSYPPIVFRDRNLARGAALLDGTLLRPGESIAFNALMGPLRRDRGFTSGPLTDDGTSGAQVGAGLSRLASTLALAGWEAGLDLVDRTPMPYHPADYPEGVDAVVAPGDGDLVLRNPFSVGVLITAQTRALSGRADRVVVVSLWSTRQVRVETTTGQRERVRPEGTAYRPGIACLPRTGQPGFSVTVTRTATPLPGASGTIDSQPTSLTTDYRPLANLVCVGE